MFVVADRYRRYGDKVSFVELKEPIRLTSGEIFIDKKIPLPIFLDTLVHAVKEKSFSETVDFKHFLEGMIFVIGMDSEFPYITEYRELVQKVKGEAIRFAYALGVKHTEKNELDYGTIFFRALKVIEPSYLDARFNLALNYEKTAFLYNPKDGEFDDFMACSQKELEELIHENPDFLPAYYKLGFYYKYRGEFLKARLTWEFFLRHDYDENYKQEIREEVERILDDASFEEAISYYQRSKFEDSLERLLKIHADSSLVEYYKALCHKEIGNTEEAEHAFLNALELDKHNPDLYNELASYYFSLGEYDASYRMYTQGIENCDEDYKLFFNRGLTELHRNNIREAYSDIHRAYEMNHEDKGVERQFMVLEDYIKKNYGGDQID